MTAARDLLSRLLPAEQLRDVEPHPTQLRALAWARVSTDMQGERGLSIPAQLREIGEFAATRKFAIVEEFTEVGSAYQSEEKRVEFHRMLARAKAGGISAILVRDFSRFSRDSLRARNLVHELREAGVRVISVTDPEADPETVAGVYLEAITHAKNEAYSREVAFHTLRGCRANIHARDPQTNWCFKNGGQPLWGYRTEILNRGGVRRGAPHAKSIWMLDSAVVAGRPLHEWVRHCLINLAGEGASLAQLADFCEGTRLPARRKAHWGTSTWNALLQPHVLMKYCGFEVWNVHRKNGTCRPSEEWVIVENAHEAILTPDEAQRIIDTRRSSSRPAHLLPKTRSRLSAYLLSGGLFKCGRCGANMTGLKGSSGTHYICGSLPYRRGRGCGPGVYVPVGFIEREVVRELRNLVGQCTDPKGFARLVNDELARMEPLETPVRADLEKELIALDGKIDRVRKAIEDGLEDVDWANQRLGELKKERAGLVREQARSDQRRERPGARRKVAVEEAMAHRRDIERLFEVGTIEEKKQLLRIWVAEMKLAPEHREVQVTFRVPEPVMLNLVAGAGFEPATFGL